MSRQPGSDELPPPLELECLSVLWRLGPANVSEVREALQPSRTLAYTTVMTLLERLAKRGLVTRQKQGRSFRYEAKVDRERVRQVAVDQLVSRLFDGSPEELRRFLGGEGSLPGPSQPPGQPSTSNLDAALL